MLDVGGQDSTEAFEDVGHSDEAREILEGLLVGNLKRQVRSSPTQWTPQCAFLAQREPTLDNNRMFPAVFGTHLGPGNRRTEHGTVPSRHLTLLCTTPHNLA